MGSIPPLSELQKLFPIVFMLLQAAQKIGAGLSTSGLAGAGNAYMTQQGMNMKYGQNNIPDLASTTDTSYNANGPSTSY